jgi:hypothetical protein
LSYSFIKCCEFIVPEMLDCWGGLSVESLPHASRRIDVGPDAIERNNTLPIGEKPREALAVVTAGWRDVIEPENFFR